MIFLFSACNSNGNNNSLSDNSIYSSNIGDSNESQFLLNDNSNSHKENNNQSNDVGSDKKNDNTFLFSTCANEIVFRNSRYGHISGNFVNIKKIELNEIIAYLINQKDYENFYLENHNVEYCLFEQNNLYYAYGDAKFPIYSIKDYAITKFIAITLPSYEDMPMLFMNMETLI